MGWGMAAKVCRFICDRSSNDSPPWDMAVDIYENFIQPVVTSHFPDFTVELFSYQDTPGLSEPFLDDLLSVDLVIADITSLNQHAYFELGVRQQSGKPLVLIADEEHTVSLRPTDLRFVPYRYDVNGFAADGKSAEDLVTSIEHALANARTDNQIKPTKQSKSNLVTRLHEAAEAIRLLRINSAAETASELETIANELSSAADDAIANAIDVTLDAFLKILSRLADQLASVRGSRMLISGIMSVVLGGTGLPAVAAFGIGLAFWEGKEVFLKALERYGRDFGDKK